MERKSRFIKIKCQDCGNEQIIFDRASTTVRCLVCGATVLKPRGGKPEIKATLVKVME